METEHVRELRGTYLRNAREALVKLLMGGKETALPKVGPACLTL